MKAIRYSLFPLTLAGLILVAPVSSRADDPPDTNTPASTQAILSPAAAEIIKLADASVGDDVMVAYIKNSAQPFDLSSDDIVYLRDLGISSDYITAMIDHDRQVAADPLAQQTVTNTAPVAATNVVAATTATTSSPTYVQNAPQEVQYFYDALSPYGTWVYLDEYGWCWQPNTVVADANWQPYSDAGHWVWSDSGWYWASDYSWGWAPFHYGRWWRSPRCGWVWNPDTVWGPSWVTWRVQNDFCGWAPLPPRTAFVGGGFSFNDGFVGLNFGFGLSADCFTFVGFHDFLGRDFRHHRFSHDRSRQVFQHTTVVNNFVHGSNNTIINRGIGTDRVTHATGRPVTTARVVDQPHRALDRNDSNLRQRGSFRHGEAREVSRTRLPEPRARENFTAQRVSAQQPVVPHVATTLATKPPTTFSPDSRRSTPTSTYHYRRETFPEAGRNSISTPTAGHFQNRAQGEQNRGRRISEPSGSANPGATFSRSTQPNPVQQRPSSVITPRSEPTPQRNTAVAPQWNRAQSQVAPTPVPARVAPMPMRENPAPQMRSTLTPFVPQARPSGLMQPQGHWGGYQGSIPSNPRSMQTPQHFSMPQPSAAPQHFNSAPQGGAGGGGRPDGGGRGHR